MVSLNQTLLRPQFLVRPLAGLALLILAGLALLSRGPVFLVQTAPVALPQMNNLPLAFVPNLNPSAVPAQYWTQGPNGTAAFARGEVAIAVRQGEAGHTAVKLQFDGANPDHTLAAGETLPGVLNSYRGADAANWQENVPLYGRLVYSQLYPGIDLVYDGRSGNLKGTYTVSPGADPSLIAWHYQGADTTQVDPQSGELHVQVGDTWLVERAPVAWQIVHGRQQPISVQYAQRENGRIGFQPGTYNPSLPLIIDPELVFGTYLGGSSEDDGQAVALDQAGNIYLVGSTFSTNFLGQNTSGVDQQDAIIIKLNPQANTLLFITYVGGDWHDNGLSIDVAANGAVYVSAEPGYADPTFPLVNPLDSAYDQYNDGVLLKLNANGQIQMSTYVHMNFPVGTSENHMAVAQDNSLVIVGDYYDPYTADRDIMVKRLNAAGTALSQVQRVQTEMSTDMAMAVALDGNGRIYLTGNTYGWEPDFPITADALHPVCGVKRVEPQSSCGADAFLMILAANGNLEYSTYLGGYADDDGRAIAVDPSGNIYVAGATFSADIETHHALQSTCPVDVTTNACFHDAYVVKLSPGGQEYIFSTYLNSTETASYDFIQGLAVDAAGNATLTGLTNGQHFPVANAFQPNLAIGICLSGYTDRFCYDAFITKLDPAGNLVFSSYLGGTFDDTAHSIALDAAGNAYLTGTTRSINFPTTTGVIQPNTAVPADFFLVKIGNTSAPPPDGEYQVYLPLVIR